ncbi:rho guanine nucleotide exchange factor 3-like isoform X3 [Branchiostoma floridae]|uniref:Rho guanine nucleotide exchange factor 3-like isoform X3 n=1 Tax=Branchiostoma floridae TaxID=7739 RepID=A0A9J7MT20_BRAFL|nr:rho guanine nucleotide exchange factor 3-like isoform X3 [Branchiostoma floridae]
MFKEPLLGRRPSLRRRSRSSSSFLTPSPAPDIPRKRKRGKDEDSLSVCSLDMKVSHKAREEPSHKRTRGLSRISSLASMLSPVKPVKKIGQTLQRSLSFRKSTDESPMTAIKPYHIAPTPTKRRESLLWSDVYAKNIRNEVLTKQQVRHQEAMFELYQGEKDMVSDLQMVKKTYYEAMRVFKIMSDEELNIIFGTMQSLQPIHQDLVVRLEAARRADGKIDNIGQTMIDWVPSLKCYVDYCAHQVAAKTLLDRKKQDHRVQDFLQRCLESPFSRKLDLWNFLDVPRSRLVKYPLLLKTIQKFTPNHSEDKALLQTAVSLVEDVIAQVDKMTGESNCRYYISRLEYLDEKNEHPLIGQSKLLLCDGILRNNRGTKLHVFLFDEILVLTRPATRNDQLCYQVYRQPLPLADLVVEDLSDGEVRMGGSFRGALMTRDGGKHVLRVAPSDPAAGQAHTLQASNEHDKKNWLQKLREAMVGKRRPLSEVKCDLTNRQTNDGDETEKGPEKKSSTVRKIAFRRRTPLNAGKNKGENQQAPEPQAQENKEKTSPEDVQKENDDKEEETKGEAHSLVAKGSKVCVVDIGLIEDEEKKEIACEERKESTTVATEKEVCVVELNDRIEEKADEAQTTDDHTEKVGKDVKGEESTEDELPNRRKTAELWEELPFIDMSGEQSVQDEDKQVGGAAEQENTTATVEEIGTSEKSCSQEDSDTTRTIDSKSKEPVVSQEAGDSVSSESCVPPQEQETHSKASRTASCTETDV